MTDSWMLWLGVGIGFGSVIVESGFPLWLPFAMVLWLFGMHALGLEIYRRYGPNGDGP